MFLQRYGSEGLMELNGKTTSPSSNTPSGTLRGKNKKEEEEEETHGRICDSTRTFKIPVLMQSSSGNLNKCL